MTYREKYQPIIQALQARIDTASHRWVLERNQQDLTEYTMLIAEMSEIKQSIKNVEDRDNG